MIAVVLPIWAWALVIIAAGIYKLVQKSSQAAENQRVADAHRSLDAKAAPPLPPPGTDPTTGSSDTSPRAQDW